MVYYAQQSQALLQFFSETDAVAFSNAHFGAGTGPIYLDDVQCTSSASQLLECSSNPILSHNCLHSADAGVGCEGMGVCIKGRFCVVQVSYGSPKQMYFLTCSSLYNWSAATGRWQHSK